MEWRGCDKLRSAFVCVARWLDYQTFNLNGKHRKQVGKGAAVKACCIFFFVDLAGL